MKQKNLLFINNLNVIYKAGGEIIFALNGIDLEIMKGETLGLVGETGAGKTTTALSVMGLLPERVGKITKGSIFFDGVNLLDKSEKEMRRVRGNQISMIFQDPMSSLNPIRTVGNQIEEVLILHGKADKGRRSLSEKVGEILEMVGIPKDRQSEYPHQFSGGMKQRIVIAIALACEPKMLLADEPTTALDVTIQAQILKLMADLKEKLQTSMLLITHDLGIVAQICDKVAIMYAGEIVESGTAYDLYKGIKHHPYTEGLFGSLPNMAERSDRLNPIPGLMPDPTDLPKGCKFHNRCPKCMEKCKHEEPIIFTEGTHKIKCHLMAC